ncbi:hypothetical protein PYH37_001765 [Sinorhizobium numidicum]|uniref:Uncharacterized protein n=1 Tax=Sinorhizobium numidicum TaxID=680248 RepID=A0ABY8CNV8_9HYPH|nr:hypothetical protein [Sinorhizobium numidicum]WEX74354.1 hypothetical protein PYH37_001765 [Sinorhizobium numidicum]WEX80341.1 hypothetical protein PYH38_001766 [Sinorhizobium numidicum]
MAGLDHAQAPDGFRVLVVFVFCAEIEAIFGLRIRTCPDQDELAAAEIEEANILARKTPPPEFLLQLLRIVGIVLLTQSGIGRFALLRVPDRQRVARLARDLKISLSSRTPVPRSCSGPAIDCSPGALSFRS